MPRLISHLRTTTCSVALAATMVTGAVVGTPTASASTLRSSSSAASPITITVWDSDSGATATGLAYDVSTFNRSQSKYKVVTDFIAAGSLPTSLSTKLLSVIGSSSAPDVVTGAALYMQTVVETNDVGDLGPIMQGPLPRPASSFYPDALAYGAVAGPYAGKIFALPTDGGDYAVFYNKKLFAEAGIATTPTTWAQLATDAKMLSHNGVYGIYLPLSAGTWTTFVWSSVLWSAGGSYLNASNTKIAFDSPQGIAAVEAWSNLIKDHEAYPSSLANSSSVFGQPAFEAGKVAMYIDGPWDLASNRLSLGASNVGVFAVPMIKRPAVAVGIDETFMVKSDPEHEAGSWAFMHFLTEPGVQALWDATSGYLPTEPATATTTEFQAYLARNPAIKVFTGQLSHGFTTPPILAMATIVNELGQELNEAFLGHETAAQALHKAAVEGSKALSGH